LVVNETGVLARGVSKKGPIVKKSKGESGGWRAGGVQQGGVGKNQPQIKRGSVIVGWGKNSNNPGNAEAFGSPNTKEDLSKRNKCRSL